MEVEAFQSDLLFELCLAQAAFEGNCLAAGDLVLSEDLKEVEVAELTAVSLGKAVSRPKNTSGFIILPRRWVVERTWSWMMRARRHLRDYERLVEHSETLITWAAITLMTRRITKARKPPERFSALL